MKLFIATPMYGGMCTGPYTSSLIDLLRELAQRGHDAMYSKIYNESLITRGRNALVKEFLSTDADAMLFIDADHGFSASDIVKMVESGEDLIGAVYPMKAVNWGRVGAAISAGKSDLHKYTGFFSANLIQSDKLVITLDKPLEVENVATGMMYISRKVFEALAPECGKYLASSSNGEILGGNYVTEFFKTEIDDRGVLLSEDYYLCSKWREKGGKVYAAPWVQISHFGAYEFSGSFAHSVVLQAELEASQAGKAQSEDSSE